MDEYMVGLVKEAVDDIDSGEVRIVDLACDTGERFEELSRFGHVTGVDEDAKAIEEAQQRHPGISASVALLCDLPFDEAFDIAFSDGAFHLIADQVALLKSVSRALALGGKLVAQMDGENSMIRVRDAFSEALSKHSGGYSCQFCLPKESSYRRVLDIAGFEPEYMETINCPQVLEGGGEGLRMFADRFFSSSLHVYRLEDRELVLSDMEDACRSDLWDEKQQAWIADVRHLRFVARKVRQVRGLGGSTQLASLII